MDGNLETVEGEESNEDVIKLLLQVWVCRSKSSNGKGQLPEMLVRSQILKQFGVHNTASKQLYHVLAIETSCDDTSVAWLDHDPISHKTHVSHNLKSTLNSILDGGIIPTAAHEHHQSHIGDLVQQITKEQRNMRNIPQPDLICVTRGPGMLGSLSTGLTMAKGLSVAWDIPLLGVNHMLGHLLVPRLYDKSLKFPFVSLLVSGGHCLLVHSTCVTEHRILCESIDIAAGDSLDKCGREIGLSGIMIGKTMDQFTEDIDDPWSINDFLIDKCQLPNPLTKGRSKHKLAFSFSPFITSIKDFLKEHPLSTLTTSQHKLLAARIQDSIFNHIVTKIIHTIESDPSMFENVSSFVCSGGVSANNKLRSKLQSVLNKHFKNFHYPPLELCTDNAVMIGWAGIEMFDRYSQSINNSLDILPIRKWSLEDIMDVSNFKYLH